MSQKKPIPKPVWYKNTYFWIGGLLLVLGVAGLIGGDALIRDPGQKREGHLYLMYFGGAIVALVNGWLSHRQTEMDFEEASDALKTYERPVAAPSE